MVLGLGVEVINGTKSEEHMKADMAGWKTWCEWVKGEEERMAWEGFIGRFRVFIGDEV